MFLVCAYVYSWNGMFLCCVHLYLPLCVLSTVCAGPPATALLGSHRSVLLWHQPNSGNKTWAMCTVCTHTYTHLTHTPTQTHKHTHTQTHPQTHPHTHTHTQTHIQTHTHTNTLAKHLQDTFRALVFEKWTSHPFRESAMLSRTVPCPSYSWRYWYWDSRLPIQPKGEVYTEVHYSLLVLSFNTYTYCVTHVRTT